MKNHPLKNDKFRTILGIILAVLAFVVVQVLISTGTLTSYYQDIVFLMCINIIMAVSLNLTTGYLGQLVLGHAGFMSVGAFSAAIFTTTVDLPAALSFPLALLIAGVVSAVVGIVIGSGVFKGDAGENTRGYMEIVKSYE